MSTIFAVKIHKQFINIALRHNGGRIEIFNKLTYALKNNRRVYAIDNTQQGIYNIGDLKRLSSIND